MIALEIIVDHKLQQPLLGQCRDNPDQIDLEKAIAITGQVKVRLYDTCS